MSPQSAIAHYRITGKLGEGGMGAVYRATDTKLNREVAVKVLPDDFAGDPDRLARFQREAQVLASLNHPNIAAIYGVEEKALVLELVEGSAPAGPMTQEQALPIVQQLIDALEYAHEKGVVHRDLKPANLKITPEGRLKVLDFGLAKALTGEVAQTDAANSPTMTMRATMAGVIIGTAAYMSPEQARGQVVDKRADIWSFGVVVYELLTGRPLFDGPTVSDTLALVLTKEIDFAAAPAEWRTLLRRCLERDARKRLRDIGDALPLVGSAEAAVPAAQNSRAKWLVGAIAAAALLTAGALAFIHFGEQAPRAEVMRFEIPAPPQVTLSNQISLSPDGRQLAFLAHKTGSPRQIWIRSLASVESRPLAGTEGAGNTFFWSPDSRFLVFEAAGQVKSLDVSSGTAQVWCTECPSFRGGAWNPDGVVLFTTNFNGLTRAKAPGEAGAPVDGGAAIRGSVAFLPDGKHYLYARQDGICAGSLDAPLRQEIRPLVPAGPRRFAYARSSTGRGFILFERSGTLLAQTIDTDRLVTIGGAVTVASAVTDFSVSDTGVLAYRSGTGDASGSQLVWYDRKGAAGAQVGPPSSWGDISISPDGKTVLTDRSENNSGAKAWSGDLARGVFSRLITGATHETGPLQLPDGRTVFSYRAQGSPGDLYAIGAGQPELWFRSEDVKHPNGISPDGKYLIYDDHTATAHQDLFVVAIPAPGMAAQKPIPFLATPADETFGQFSPDGRWVAYSSDETGRREVYVREFLPNAVPAAGARKWLISTDGGDKPRWARNGKELYFLSPSGKLMATPVKTAPQFEPGIPAALFEVSVTGFAPYDVAADGRFLVNTPAPSGGDSSTPITVVLNWTAGLR